MSPKLPLIIALMLVSSCKKEEPPLSEVAEVARPKAPEGAAEKALAKAPSTGRELLLALPTTENACGEVYDYFPGGGMRIFWCHAQNVVPYSALAELSGGPVFVSGPHQPGALVLDSKTSFGHYRPGFVRWLLDKVLPSVTDPSARKEIEPIYDRYLRERGRIYLSALSFLKANPDYWEAEKKSYLEHEDPQHRHDRHAPEAWPNEFPPAVAFWLRRSIDGTQPLFEEGLTKMIAALDPHANEELAGKDWKIAEEAVPADAPLPFKGDTLEVKVKNAWAALAHLAPETACPQQFAYEPGGLRVQYCRAAAVIGYPALQAKLDFPIFVKGPHTKAGLQLESSEFGHYNPKFVEWLFDHAIPAANDPQLRTLSQPSYDRHLQTPARLMLYTRELLKRDGALKEKMRTEYQTFLKNPDPIAQPRFGWESMISSDSYEAQAIGGSAFAFWIRRALDNTDNAFDRVLRKGMKAYDPEFLRRIEGAKTVGELKEASGFAAVEQEATGEGEEEYGE